MKFTQSSIESLREAIDMVDLVSGHTELKRAGTQFSGLCPFHDERSPSFSINPVEKLYYCFGCGEGGDAIKFAQKAENLEFPEAVEWLAERYGITLETEQSDPAADARRKQLERLFELLERTTGFYERHLWESVEGAKGLEYLRGRGFSDDVLKKFRVGFAPSAWDKVMMSALKTGFSEEELRLAGLGQKSSKGRGFYDRFRSRIMFPLSDLRGRVRGYGARALRDSEKPKYLNTSDGPVYRKGRQLFGLHLARASAAKKGRAIAVEGYADVLALHDAGFDESVAIMGTAVTDEQLVELSRLAPNVLLALDADRAGRQAMVRAGRIAEKNGIDLRVVQLPAGKDPADIVTGDGAEAFERALAASISVLEFEVASVLDAADLASARGRDAALTELEPIFAGASSGAVKEEQVRKVASALDLPDATMGRLRQSGGAIAQSKTFSKDRSVSARREANERVYMAMCLAVPDHGRDYLRRLQDQQLSTQLMRELRDWLGDHFERPLEGTAELADELRDAISEVAMRSATVEASPQSIHLSYLQLKKAGIERALMDAPRDRKLDLSAERQEVVRLLGELTTEYV